MSKAPDNHDFFKISKLIKNERGAIFFANSAQFLEVFRELFEVFREIFRRIRPRETLTTPKLYKL